MGVEMSASRGARSGEAGSGLQGPHLPLVLLLPWLLCDEPLPGQPWPGRVHVFFWMSDVELTFVGNEKVLSLENIAVYISNTKFLMELEILLCRIRRLALPMHLSKYHIPR